jgi:hypothetical protein
MSDMARTRSPHVRLQEFIDCFLTTDHKAELESFSDPKLTRSTREEVSDEAMRYFALLLLYGIDEKAKDMSIVRKAPDRAVCRMAGDKFYDVPAPREEVVTSLFDQMEEMAGMDETKRVGSLVVGIKNDQITLKMQTTITDAGEEKIIVHLPSLA